MFQFLNEQIRDNNISTAVGAMTLVIQLVKSLKERSAPYLPLVIEAILLMYRDKRQFVVDEINGCLEAVIKYNTFDMVSDSVLPCVTNQVKDIQIGTIGFI